MSKKIPAFSNPKPTKLTLGKQTVRDLATTKSGAEKVRGGGSTNITSNVGSAKPGEASRLCAAVC